ncbi:tectonin beta-propeller repeat-containing protein 2-like [Antedon mediterranea]|uniref:tectonin beta-propeller repeat-containing protein 2-like n=1 Tax=Antedon mediterranea TaxID=105859 RepID=UPI003AF5EA96
MENLREYEPLSYLVNVMPKKAQRGLTSLNVEWLSMDVNADFIAIGVNFGMLFLLNRKDRQMTKIRCQDKSGKITALKMLKALDYQVAIGTSTGTVELHLLPKPGRPQQVEMFSLKAHKSQVTCVEWSTNGMKLYSGDNQGVIVCTEVDFYEKKCTTLVILKESDPVVQLSYSRKSLLVSTWYRTVIFESDSKSIKQVGQQPRKCKGTFGANFIPAVCKASDAKFYLSRPGLRLWRSDMDGKVEETLLFKDLINLGYPQLQLLEDTPSLIQDGQSEVQLGPVIMYKETLVISWSYSSLFILDPINKTIVGGCAGSLGSIMGVSVVNDEIFILTKGAGRPLIRLASNPENIYSRLSDHTQFTMEELQILQKQNEERRAKEESQEHQTDSEQKSKVLQFFDKAVDGIANNAKKTKDNLEKLELKFKQSPKASPKPSPKPSPTPNRKESTSGQSAPKTPAADLSVDVLAALKEAEENHKVNESSLGNQFPTADANVGKDAVDDSSTRVNNFDEISTEKFEEDLVYDGHKKKKKKKKKDKKKDDKSSLSDFPITSPEIGTSPRTQEVDEDQLLPQDDSINVSTSGEIYERGNVTSREQNENVQFDNTDQLFNAIPPCSTDASHSKIQTSRNYVEPFHSNIQPSQNSIEPFHIGDINDIGYDDKYGNNLVNVNDLSKEDNAIGSDIGSLTSKPGSCEDNLMNHNGYPQSPDVSDPCAFYENGTSSDEIHSLKENNLPAEPGDADIYDIYNQPKSLDSSKSLEIVHDADVISESSESQESEMSKEDLNIPEGIQQKVAGSWVQCDTPGVITQLIISDKHIWFVDNHDKVHFKLINGSKNKWDKLRESAQQMAVSHTESIVWRVHRKTGIAYASAPITPRSPIGSKWAPACNDVRYVSLDENIAWIVKTNHDVYVQQNLSRDRVCSRSIKVSSSFQTKMDQVVTSRGVAWGRVMDGTIVYRLGITATKQIGNQWVQFDNQSFDVASIALDSRNTGWVIDQDGNVWFKTGVTMETPQGDTNHWWQVPMSQYLMQDQSYFKTIFNTMSHHLKVQHQPRPMLVGASSAGVWVVGSGHDKSSLYASKGNLIGHYWNVVSPHGLSQSIQWLCISASGTYATSGMVWTLQKSGEVFCFPSDTLRPSLVEPPTIKDNLTYLSSSAYGLWAIGESNTVYVRDGISERHPQGLKWKTLNLSQLRSNKVVHLSCGSIAVWACDDEGAIYFRLGLCMPRNDTMVPAWVLVDGKPAGNGTYFTNVYVGPSDNIVWALDNKKNVYARGGISELLPIGLKWEIVQGTPANQLCVSSETVWALCPNGDVARRYGITERNPLGDYWKKIPGNFSYISVSQNDELWSIDVNGHIYQQCVKMFNRGVDDLEHTKIMEEEEWDVI